MSTTQSDSPKGATPPISTNILTDKEGEYIAVVCGSIEGKLYFNKLKGCKCPTKLGSVKCILGASDTWCSPIEFESSGS